MTMTITHWHYVIIVFQRGCAVAAAAPTRRRCSKDRFRIPARCVWADITHQSHRQYNTLKRQGRLKICITTKRLKCEKHQQKTFIAKTSKWNGCTILFYWLFVTATHLYSSIKRNTISFTKHISEGRGGPWTLHLDNRRRTYNAITSTGANGWPLVYRRTHLRAHCAAATAVN